MSKNPMQKVTTPKVELEWVTINDGEGKENLSGKAQYVANGVFLTDEEVAEFEKQINDFWAENKPAKYKGEMKSNGLYKHKAATEEKDEEGKTIYAEDGRTYVAFKTGIAYSDGSDKVVKIYNAKGRPTALPSGVKIGNGTIAMIGGAMGIYTTMDKSGKTIVNAGVTFYLNSLRIFKLEEYAGEEDFQEDDSAEGWTGEDDSWEGEEATADTKAKPRI